MDDEIIIGVDIKDDNNTKKKKKSKANNKKKINKSNKSNNKKTSTSRIKNQRKQKQPKQQMNPKKILIVKIFVSIIILVAIVSAILVSPIFNVKIIEVNGNSKLSNEMVISISEIQYQKNIFDFNRLNVREKLLENAYIEKVNVKRHLPSKVEITIEERVPRYMLQFADSYVYINNQGYMLEISNEKLDIPILLGFVTDLSNIKAGNRIDLKDLKKMDMVIKIFEVAKSNNFAELITKIDISNDKNYTIVLDTEEKIVYLGDGSDLNTRMLYLESILKSTQGKSGEIFLNVDLNNEHVYFRPSSN